MQRDKITGKHMPDIRKRNMPRGERELGDLCMYVGYSCSPLVHVHAQHLPIQRLGNLEMVGDERGGARA